MSERKRKYFGTDGIRGTVGEHPITPDFVMKLGWAAGRVLSAHAPGRQKVLIGKDTRVSGYMFESALEAGLSAAGIDIHLLGPMPTPGIAYLTRTFHAQAGIVISASHNPFDDNGIKFFSHAGTKLPDEIELEIEAELDRPLETVASRELGKARRVEDAAGRYIEFCKGTVRSSISLAGLKMVVDCAHGATYHIAPAVFSELGAQVITLGNTPDGFNINHECGATDPSALQAAVLKHGADVGVALDGDGDRLIMVDHKGELVDGDELVFIIARRRQQAGQLRGSVVGTQMSNLGLEQAIRTIGLGFERAKVGDRYILEKLRDGGWTLGGESSGHIICLDLTTTGDGIISALQVLEAMIGGEQSLHDLKSGMQKCPQTLVNVRMEKKVDVMSLPDVQRAVAQAEARLANSGRVLLRPSGTEPVIRVMVEGRDSALVEEMANDIAQKVESAARVAIAEVAA
ncbi:MAG: phosphoglucosamine mutase [Proteobacteria bacterium]|jgi:phosphoglucosamine mutase|nr:phosphoglucosamine mutase [Pseudomonadota bacterium]